ncbi:2,4-dihydroxyhept-2-ene-1,7-dioic acid aldolase [Capronia coronata CBS 617.96]|uniref:2,4-dihydroxyhept-2-ene-1,7-dioic acid aldolase n=1 Tax=Capronia coronata CBS 617.96 TaxID=1182541 RepID=W9XT27_9EURO|nr:2,4-dihydroxyhept-2-ene-1,7-dioic acid aldolase [Capronia coronata CBS 617.96]EXJ80156.1 2,4-dihydroxyhept-2-ene-1,7-dioic acid aldolase [Capronia coronata CBS 617.96]
MQNANTLKKALNTGSGVSFGAWQMLPGSYVSKAIAQAGYDWVLIDCEHGNIADNEMHHSVHAVAGCGASPIVRLPAMDSWMIKRALDAGAHGVLLPLLRTADDARSIVQACKFPPQGRRGFGSPFSMGAFHPRGDLSGLAYLENANDHILTIVQIETQEALANVDEIAKVDGIDVLFVGPFDLGNNIGHPIRGEFAPELKEAILKVQAAARNAGKKTGIYCTDGKMAREYADAGFQMISVVNDMTVLPTGMANALSIAKGTKQEAKGTAYGGTT